EAQALSLISSCTGLLLPDNRRSLKKDGLSPLALEKEIIRGVSGISIPTLAGIELVNLPGVTHLQTAQIQADLSALRRAKPSGLSLSWDLLHIQMSKLELVRKVYLEGQ
ncbi:MAG TPA: hypothetical protein VLD65_11505, partial [Anaerolineales bacterium]|nr:hypothetical protein [Anaerolineales bacterium]